MNSQAEVGQWQIALTAASIAFFFIYSEEVLLITFTISTARSLHMSAVATSDKAARARATTNLLLLYKSPRILWVLMISTPLSQVNSQVNPRYPIFLAAKDCWVNSRMQSFWPKSVSQPIILMNSNLAMFLSRESFCPAENWLRIRADSLLIRARSSFKVLQQRMERMKSRSLD